MIEVWRQFGGNDNHSQDQVQINHLLKICNFALLNIVDTNKGVLTDTKHLA